MSSLLCFYYAWLKKILNHKRRIPYRWADWLKMYEKWKILCLGHCSVLLMKHHVQGNINKAFNGGGLHFQGVILWPLWESIESGKQTLYWRVAKSSLLIHKLHSHLDLDYVWLALLKPQCPPQITHIIKKGHINSIKNPTLSPSKTVPTAEDQAQKQMRLQ